MKKIPSDQVIPFRKTTPRDVVWARMKVGDALVEADRSQWVSIKSSVSRFNSKKKVHIRCSVGLPKNGGDRKVMFIQRIR